MTFEAVPGVIDGVSMDAKHWRHVTQALIGSPVGSFAGGVSAIGPGHGVCYPTAMKVTQSGTPAMSVQVAPGTGLVTGTVSAEQGPYGVYNDANYTVTISAAHATLARWDLIIVQVRDAAYSGVDKDVRCIAVPGTPAGSPSDPSLSSYPNALVIARVVVAAAATSITNAAIADLRMEAGSWWNARGWVTDASSGSSGVANSGSVGVLGAGAFVAEANRKYKVTVSYGGTIQVGAGASEVQIHRGAPGTTLVTSARNAAAGTAPGASYAVVDTPGAGSVQYYLYTFTSATSVQLQSNYGIIVEDIGGVLA